MHTYIHRYIYRYIRINTNAYIHTRMLKCLHTHIHTYIQTNNLLCILEHAYLHSYIPTYLHPYIHKHMCVQTYIHTNIYMYILTKLRTYTPTCICTCVFIRTYTPTYIPAHIHLNVQINLCRCWGSQVSLSLCLVFFLSRAFIRALSAFLSCSTLQHTATHCNTLHDVTLSHYGLMLLSAFLSSLSLFLSLPLSHTHTYNIFPFPPHSSFSQPTYMRTWLSFFSPPFFLPFFFPFFLSLACTHARKLSLTRAMHVISKVARSDVYVVSKVAHVCDESSDT